MAWRIVQQPNGLLARFSDIVDDFTDINLTHEQAVHICIHQYGLSQENAEAKVQRGEQAGMTRWPDEIQTIRIVHGKQRADERCTQCKEQQPSQP